MSDGPNIENSFKNLLYTALLKKSHHRAHTGNVDMNLSVIKKNCVSGNFVNGRKKHTRTSEPGTLGPLSYLAH